MKPEKGVKTTEFWAVASLLADLLFRRVGLYDYITLEQLADVTAQVQAIADQLKGATGDDSPGLYVLVGVYVCWRSAIKWRAEGRRHAG